MKKPFILLALLFVLLIFSSRSEAQQSRLEHFTEQHGLSQNTVWSIHQDREGFMWFGTQDGLNKFDGYKFTVLKPDPDDPEHTLQHNIISDIHEDRKGRLWVTTLGGGLHQVDKPTGNVTRFGIKPTNTVLWNGLASIYEDKKGLLWITGYGGVASFDPELKKFRLYPLPSGIVWITSVAEDAAGRFWASGSGGVYQLNRSSRKFIPVLLDLTLTRQPDCWSLYLDKKGILWAGTNGEGLFNLNSRTGKDHFTRYNPGSLVSKSFRFNSIYEDPQGTLWLSGSEGLQRMDTKSGKIFNFQLNSSQPGSLSYRNVSSVYQDRTGALWIGTNNGISKVSAHPLNFRTYQIIPTLPQIIRHENNISTLLEDDAGKIWLGSAGSSLNENFENGLYQFDPGSKKIQHFPANAFDPNMLASNKVWSLYEDQNKKFWVGTEEALHLFDRNTGKFKRYPSELPIEHIAEDASGKLWVGGRSTYTTGSGGIAYFNPDDGRFRYYMYDPQNANGLKDGDVYDILVSLNGDIWVALSGGGVARLNLKTDQFTSYLPGPAGSPGHLNDKDVRALYEDKEGVIWAGTNKGGLHRFDTRTNTFIYFTIRNGLPSNHIESITGDEKGNLWLSTNKGISRFNPKNKTFQNFDTDDGLPVNEFKPGSVYRHDGRLMFGSVNGFVLFNPDSIRNNTSIPPVYITAIKVMEKPRDIPAGKLELPYNENFLSFEFVALNYDTPEKNQYAYRLEGVDKNWVNSATRRFASYTNLDPGKYTFRVKGSNNDGVWNEKGTSIHITIRPPWWQTWWAYGLYGLYFLAGGFALARYQRQQLIQKEREKARERELEQAREIEKAYHELRQTQTQLIQKEKMASLGELTAGIAHEIQNPLNFVNNFSEVSRELCQEVQEEINHLKVPEKEKQVLLDLVSDLAQNQEKINYHGQRADLIVKSMLQHSRAGSGEKQLTDINALAEEYLRLAYHGLRAKDHDYNANLVTDFDKTLGKVEVVPQDLGRVLLNLYNNAFYATQQKEAQLNGQYQPEVKVTTCQRKDFLEIKVRDNGSGIPESIKNKIFQPFFTTKPPGQGTGLGLSLSYEIINKGLGGNLKVDTLAGEYSEFIILLPKS